MNFGINSDVMTHMMVHMIWIWENINLWFVVLYTQKDECDSSKGYKDEDQVCGPDLLTCHIVTHDHSY